MTIDKFIKRKNTSGIKDITPSLTPSSSSASTKKSQLIKVYCDGSTTNNGSKKAAGGIGIYFGPNDPRNVSEPYLKGTPTNQRTELYALTRTLQILEAIIDIDRESVYDCHIYTDSEYVINCLEKWIPSWMTHDWVKWNGKPVKNIELLKVLASHYYSHRKFYKIHHIHSHTDGTTPECEGNRQADQLAVQGTRQHPNFHSNFKN